jgi:hypothetical protein
MEESTVRFEVNVNAAKRAGLKINSKLLSLAKILKDGSPRTTTTVWDPLPKLADFFRQR